MDSESQPVGPRGFLLVSPKRYPLKIAIENGPVEIVDLPINSMVILTIVT